MLFQNITVLDSRTERAKQFVFVEDKTIRYVGELDPRCGDAFGGVDFGEIYDGSKKVMIPGLVNDHCHVPMTSMRGYGEGLALQDWLEKKIFPFEAHLTEDDVYWGSLLGIAEMLASGVTSFTDMYFLTDAIYRAVWESGIKANLSATFVGSGDDHIKDHAAWAATERLLELAKQSDGRIVADVSLHAEYTSTPQITREVAAYAQSMGLRAQVHLSETKREHEECKQRHEGRTPTAYLADCGFFEGATVCAHGVHVSLTDLDILAEKKATLCHCPSSNLKLGSGFAPLAQWQEKGINVTVGTDGPASNNNLNMIEELSLAYLIHKGYNNDPQFLSAAELLEMATVNGQRSQGRKDAGLIAAGQAADLVVLDYDKPHLTPVYNALDHLFASVQASDVVLTMVDGKILYRDGKWMTLDLARVKAELRRIQEEKLLQV